MMVVGTICDHLARFSIACSPMFEVTDWHLKPLASANKFVQASCCPISPAVCWRPISGFFILGYFLFSAVIPQPFQILTDHWLG